MFLVCEPIAIGFEHVPFNAGILRTVRTAFPGARIVFYGEETHSAQVREQLGVDLSSSIDWVDVKLPVRSAGFYRRLLPDLHTLRTLLGRLKRDRSFQVLTFTSANPSLLWALKFYMVASRGRRNVQVFLHGDFALLRYRASLYQHLNPFYHLGSFRTAVRFASDPRVQYVVLEQAVLDIILEKYEFLRDRYRVLEHPLPGDRQSVMAIQSHGTPIKFGYLGRAYETKGFPEFLEVAARISQVLPGRAEFHVIGSVSEQQEKKYGAYFVYLADKPRTQTIDRDEYVRRVDDLHYVCLFYDEKYEFTASGVLLDCVERRKPIVASERSIFVQMKTAFPDFGYLCAKDDYANVIQDIVSQFDPELYERQVEAMAAIRESRSPKALSMRYHELVDDLQGRAP